MAKLFFLLTCVFSFGTYTLAQTWGCPERDYKCQLDGRMKALQADPKNPENYYNVGLVFQRAGAHKEAVESFSMYVAIPGVQPEQLADGYNNRAISYRAIKRSDLAIADYTKAIQLFPKKSAQFLTNRASAYRDQKDSGKALADYEAAVKADPKYVPAYAQRGSMHSDESRIEDALRDFGKSIELDPSYAEPYYNRGTIYFQRQEFAKAIPDYDKYVTLAKDPVYLADGYMNRAISHHSTGNPQKALADLTKVIELQPRFVNGYRARAMVYRELKKNDLAEADERKAAELSAGRDPK